MRVYIDQPIRIERPSNDWMTKYPAKDVGGYLEWFRHAHPYELGEVIEMKPGQILPQPPMPSLEGFLSWNLTEKKKKNTSKSRKKTING